MHSHSSTLVATSVAIAVLASYVALDLANSVSVAKGSGDVCDRGEKP